MKNELFKTIGNIFFITFPMLGFVPQIASKKIVFPSLLSILTIYSSTFKIFYVKADPLDPIVPQALLLIVFHFFLLYAYKQNLSVLEKRIFHNRFVDSYIVKHGLFTVILCSVVMIGISLDSLILLAPTPIFYTACGIIAIACEMSIGIVQIIMRRIDKKYGIEKRLAKELFLCWALGDAVKVAWMIYIKSHFALILSVVFQIGVDIVLLFE
ncbi:hypothetical protein TCON_0636 [Astathelohania contejeani]|uniref:Uncharacterized protein n=1 Tax=Astathelohania contejeani TaxID=164912 RepID=A0ABQ7I112_9MICR|nr:hypothetical protein TCON_0636 [Thelohania contejeani]